MAPKATETPNNAMTGNRPMRVCGSVMKTNSNASSRV
jgi:hypothetical protein